MRTKLISERTRAGYTQYSMAVALGTSRSHYAQIETGDKSPSLKLAIKIKTVLHYKQDDIFFCDQIRPKRGRVPRGTIKS